VAAQIALSPGQDGVQLAVLEVERDQHSGVGAAPDIEADRVLRREQDTPEIVPDRAHIGTIFGEMEALIVVDVQNDFCPGGALAVPGGDEIVGAVNRLATEAPPVIATRDWHPPDHRSFVEEGGTWPVHCVRETAGAQLHPDLHASLDMIIDKGQAREHEGYSGFGGTGLERLLRERGVDTVHVVGLALDYCVKATALDAREAGFDVVVHREATRAVNVEPGDDERAVADLRAAGVEVR
jgi:nicotinamidase/pyrazinamidase